MATFYKVECARFRVSRSNKGSKIAAEGDMQRILFGSVADNCSDEDSADDPIFIFSLFVAHSETIRNVKQAIHRNRKEFTTIVIRTKISCFSALDKKGLRKIYRNSYNLPI